MRAVPKELYAVKITNPDLLRGGGPPAWGGTHSEEWGGPEGNNMAKRIRARRRMPWGTGAKKAVASHERPGGAADTH